MMAVLRTFCSAVSLMTLANGPLELGCEILYGDKLVINMYVYWEPR